MRRFGNLLPVAWMALAAVTMSSAALALNPQPEPPLPEAKKGLPQTKGPSVKSKSLGKQPKAPAKKIDTINPATPKSLNPQPLPPKEIGKKPAAPQ